MKYYEEEKPEVTKEFGCGFCWDLKKEKTKELFFVDAANNFRPCVYCPYCGRQLEE